MPKMLITPAVGKTSDHLHPFKILICCQTCRGQNVGRDATARWSMADQVWELGGVNDDGFCDDCDTEIRLVERHVDMEGNDAGPVSSADMFDGERFEDQALPSPVDKREFATILAALRLWQRVGTKVSDTFPEAMIASDAGSMLTDDEVNALCERLNQ